MDSIKQKGRRDKLIKYSDSLAISRKLVKLETAIPIKNMTLPDSFSSVEDLRMEARTMFNDERLLQFYSDMGLKDIARRVTLRLYQNQPMTTSSSTTRNKNGNPPSMDRSVSIDEMKAENVTSPALENSFALSFASRRPKPAPEPMDYDDVPF